VKLARLRGMDRAEITGRAGQALRRWLERAGVAGVSRAGPHAVLAALTPEGEVGDIRARAKAGDADGAARALRDRFRTEAPRRFFPGAAERAAAASESPGGHAEEILAAADAVTAGRFDLLGYSSLRFGDPVDWQLDPVSGARAPLVHWSRIAFLDPREVGDSKVTWELSRHQWLVTLAQAYRLTGDERHAETALRALEAWLVANPPGMGINWASSLEAAIRIVSWSWMLVLLCDAEALSPRRFEAVLQATWIHASHVERHLSTYFSPNTHLTGEALGLFYAGVLFPELTRAARWRELGARLLASEIERQVYPDGVHFELSTCYQRYMVETAAHFLVLAGRNGIRVPPSVEERAVAMTDFLVSVRRPDGTVPQIGDADGGWLLPLARRQPEDMRGVFSVAAALWRRGAHAWAAGGPAAETLWMLGQQGAEAAAAVHPQPPPDRAIDVFPDGGYVVMRSGWDAEAHHLVFDAGPLGCPASAGHGHADLLAVQCSAYGETFLVDAGTGRYVDADGWRSYFRGTVAHSTVTLDGKSQARPTGPFSWEARPAARLLTWGDGPGVFAEGEHAAYSRPDDPVRHRRRVLFPFRRFWILIDDVEGGTAHAVELRFQFAAVPVFQEAGGWVRASGRRRGLRLRAFATRALALRVTEGGTEPREGWISAAYGRREPAPMAVYSAAGPLPLRMVTLVLPMESPEAPAPDVDVVAEGDRLVALEVGGSIVRLDSGPDPHARGARQNA
jgi:hypothetical protein